LVFIGLLMFATRLIEEIRSPEQLNGKLPEQGFPVVVQYVDNGQISLADWRVAKEEQSRRPFSLVRVPGDNRIELSDTAWFKYSIGADAAGNKMVDLTSKNSDSTKRAKYRVTDHEVFPLELAVDSPGDVMLAFPIAALALLVIVFLKKKIMGAKDATIV
jgi:hypothetical protein